MLLIDDATYINSMDAAKKANMKKEQKLGRRLGRQVGTNLFDMQLNEAVLKTKFPKFQQKRSTVHWWKMPCF